MKKRSEHCLLMHSRMVTAVAITSAQRHAPLNVRTRVTSASCMLACGSSNTIRCTGATTLSLTEDDIVSPEHGVRLGPERLRRYYSKPFGIFALASVAARAFIQPSRKALSSDGGLALL